MALISDTDLATHLRSAHDPVDESLIQAVAMACGYVTEYVRQPVEETTETLKLLVRRYDNVVKLPRSPVTAVVSVATPTGVLPPTGWTWDGVSRQIVLNSYEESATVVFTAGYSTVPTVVKGVALTVARRMYSNPSGVRTQQIDDASVTYSDVGSGLLPQEMMLLDDYRIIGGQLR